MNNDKKQKIIKALLSLMISFLMIFIVAMFARVASNTILPQNSKMAVLINDYLDMMVEMVDKFAINIKIKRNTVSEYQVNLITQSISDYVGYSMYQTSDIVKDYNPYRNYSKAELEKYKNDYYKMTLENPYLRSMTVFSIDGKMRLNLYLANNKSWPIELQDNLLKEIKTKGSLVLNADNENAFYIMEYIKNKNGEMIVATRNDYSYVSDIAMYYQVADKRLYVSDSRDLVYNVRESVGDKSIEKVSSVINKFAYYKKQPSFIVNDSISVSMIGKEYPNYFELIVLAITALFILLFQVIINAIINFFKYLMQIKRNRDFLESVKGENELFIDESLVKADIPKSTTLDDMPPMIEKLHYQIPEQYFENNNNNKQNKFDISKDIINIVNKVKDNIYKTDDNIEKNNNETTEIEAKIIEKDIAENIQQGDDYYSLDNIENKIDNELDAKNSEIYEEIIDEYNNEEITVKEIKEETFNKEVEDDSLEYNSLEDDIQLENDNYEYNISKEYNTEEINHYVDETNKYDDSIYNAEENNNYITEDNNISYDGYYSLNSEYYKLDEDSFDKSDEEVFNRKIIKSDSELLYKDSLENKNIINSSSNTSEEDIKVNDEIYNSYNNIENKNSDLKNIDTMKTEDVFAAFDKMLSSIISKAEEDAKRTITKK